MALDPATLPDNVDALKRLIVGLAREAVHASALTHSEDSQEA